MNQPGTCLFSRPADINQYAAGDVVGTTTMLYASGISTNDKATKVMIKNAMLSIYVNAVPSGMGAFRCHIYAKEPATLIADNAAFNYSTADRNIYQGYFDFSTPIDRGDTLHSQVDGVDFIANLYGPKLYFYLETLSIWTPASATQFLVQFKGFGL